MKVRKWDFGFLTIDGNRQRRAAAAVAARAGVDDGDVERELERVVRIRTLRVRGGHGRAPQRAVILDVPDAREAEEMDGGVADIRSLRASQEA